MWCLSNKLHLADILLVDIDMPEINGIEAAKRINFDHPSLPMVAITMHQDRVYLLDIVSAGFQGFVSKPEAAKNLFDTIDQVINKEFAFPDSLETKK